MSAHGSVEYLSPDSMHKNRAYTQVISVTGPAKTIYIGGQDAVDSAGNIVGKDDLAAQTRQILINIKNALAAAGAEPKHLIKLTIFIVQGQPIQAGFAAFQQVWGRQSNPPAVTAAFVSALAHPDFLVEIEAVAVIPL